MNIISRLMAWWRRRRFKKIANQTANSLVGTPGNPITIKRFKKNEKPKPYKVRPIVDESMAAVTTMDSPHAIRQTSWSSKAPGAVRREVFNKDGELVKVIHQPFQDKKKLDDFTNYMKKHGWS